MQGHPNTTAAGLSTLAGTGLVWLLNHYAHTRLNAYDAALIVGGLATVRLWVGRRGVRGVLRDLWRGVNGPPSPTQGA